MRIVVRERAARVATALAMLLAVWWAASVPLLAQSAPGSRDGQPAVGALAFRVEETALRDPRLGLGHLVRPGRQGGWRVPIAAGAVAAALLGAALRPRRLASLSAARRRPRMPAWRWCRAPPWFRPAR